MRILIATTHRNVAGGLEKYLHGIIPALADRGHAIALAYESRFDPTRESIDPPGLNLPAGSLYESGFESAVRFVEEWKPDVVFSQGLESNRFQDALLDRYPALLFAHNYLGTCATGQKCHAFPGPQPCRRLFGPACLALHYPRRCGGLNPKTMWTMYRRSAEVNRQLPRYQAVLVASRHMYGEFERHGVGADRLHLVTLPNPQDARQAPIRTGARNRLLYVGRLTKLKGVGHLLRAIPIAARKLARPLRLTVAGDGPERENLKRLAGELHLAADFAGWIQGGRMRDLMLESDLLVVPSLWPEPFGLVGIEAGACGLPAVAYNVGGIPEWLVAGRSGELAPGDPPTVNGLADAMVRALEDSQHHDRLSRGAFEVASGFTLQRHLSQLEKVLETVRRRPAGAVLSAESIHA